MAGSTTYQCERCQRNPHPSGFADQRRCAFDADGNFVPDNWNCATLDALLVYAQADVWGCDNSLQVVSCEDGGDDGGFLVLTRYKNRGCTSWITRVGDFEGAQPVTRETVERVITWWEWTKARASAGDHR